MSPVNPIKEIRVNHNQTQKSLASIAGITEQVILKAEAGLYPTLPPSVLRALATVSGESKDSIESKYEAWIDSELRSVVLPKHTGFETPAGFIGWRSVVCRMNDVADNTNSFCKLFKMNPYVIQKFEAGKLKQTPMQLVERIAFIRESKGQ